MPELCDITYSREECIAAVRGYYQFLTTMYLKESDILEPPEGGWPSVTPSAIQQLGKTDELGVIYWPECPGDIQHDPDAPCERVWDDPYEYASTSEAEWRAEGAYWSIPDFFEIIKDQFRRLLFIPISTITVIDVYHHGKMFWYFEFLQEIYREHGWPDLEKYNKVECLKDIRKRLMEKYPDNVDHDENPNE
ncbi:hypothetical protein TEQG_07616 [Trichophyton equinum CBS 127.97]|uniref:Uncharacterized protein n=1 Tax=Trichophyton equinum (strain ATCC MYA-4606 / CBS 127.97) TaxID=559882 RepID=F2Q3D7_TRIEC|nr:hypothetical protein TEQG_07616 [Trichophyton equinum CBS 127.97]